MRPGSAPVRWAMPWRSAHLPRPCSARRWPGACATAPCGIVTMQSLHGIEEPPVPGSDRFALWALGFRPFYLLASVFAALSVPLWALQFTGWLPLPYLSGPLWHAHEMVFGFTLAVIVGFLFTAGRNWSNQPTPSGWPLMLLAL